MSRQGQKPDARGKAGAKKLAVKKVALKNLDSPKTKDPKGGRALTRRNDY